MKTKIKCGIETHCSFFFFFKCIRTSDGLYICFVFFFTIRNLSLSGRGSESCWCFLGPVLKPVISKLRLVAPSSIAPTEHKEKFCCVNSYYEILPSCTTFTPLVRSLIPDHLSVNIHFQHYIYCVI